MQAGLLRKTTGNAWVFPPSSLNVDWIMCLHGEPHLRGEPCECGETLSDGETSYCRFSFSVWVGCPGANPVHHVQPRLVPGTRGLTFFRLYLVLGKPQFNPRYRKGQTPCQDTLLSSGSIVRNPMACRLLPHLSSRIPEMRIPTQNMLE
jgi:hypothetical protein